MANYPIPPWLHGNNPTELAALAQAGQKASIQFGMERQRMQQQQQMAEMELVAKQAAQEQAQMRQAQELQVEKAYKDASLGLRQQELAQQEQRINSQVKVASQKAMAQAEASRRIAAGEDPSKVWMEMGPMLGAPASSMAALAGGQTPMNYPGAQTIEGLPEDLFKGVQTGPRTRAIVRLPQKFEGSSVSSVPVTDENGEPIEGVFGVPNATGGVSIHNVPKKTGYEAAQANLASKQAAAGGTKTATGTTPSPRLARARELHKLHPDWTKPQILAQVNKEFGSP